jgi:hypothetical protein
MKAILFALLLVYSANLKASEITSFQVTIAHADAAKTKLDTNQVVSLIVSLNRPETNLKVNLDQFDARMPAHNHGMVVKPKITPLSGNQWKIDGVKLHMAGQWYFYLTFSIDDQQAQISIPYMME